MGFIFGTPVSTSNVIATGSVTPRSLPDRFAEVHNVLDFGADPTGATDSAAAIQACVDWASVSLVTTGSTLVASGEPGNMTLHFADVPQAFQDMLTAAWFCTAYDVTDPSKITLGMNVINKSSTTVVIAGPVSGDIPAGHTIKFDFADKGTIFFPPGVYKALSAITLDFQGAMSVTIEGSGGRSILQANHANYAIDRNTGGINSGIRVVRNLFVQNLHTTGGGIRLNGCVGSSVENCNINAYRGACFDQNNSALIYNCKLQGPRTSGSIGVFGTNGFTAINCDIQGYEHGYRTCNIGQQIIGGRIEVSDIGVMVGQNISGATNQASGFLITGISMEAVETAAVYIHSGAAGVVAGISLGLSEGMPGTRGIYVGGGPLTFIGNNISGPYTVASVDCTGAQGNEDIIFIGNTFSNTSGTRWLLPTDRWKIKIQGGDRVFNATCTVSQLNNTDRYEGDESIVSDGANGLAWGATISAGGTTTYKVCYLNGAWRVMGKA